MSAAETITVPKPTVPFGPDGIEPDVATASYFREAARRIAHQRLFGSNLTNTLAIYLNATADVLDGAR